MRLKMLKPITKIKVPNNVFKPAIGFCTFYLYFKTVYDNYQKTIQLYLTDELHLRLSHC